MLLICVSGRGFGVARFWGVLCSYFSFSCERKRWHCSGNGSVWNGFSLARFKEITFHVVSVAVLMVDGHLLLGLPLSSFSCY